MTSHNSPSPQAPRPWFLINRLRTAMQEQTVEGFRTIRLTPAVGEVLQAIAIEGNASTSAISRRLGITPQSVAQSTGILVNLGYVQRTKSLHDERIFNLKITRTGYEAMRKTHEIMDQMYEKLFGGLKPRERRRLSELLAKLIHDIHPESIELYVDRQFNPPEEGA